LKSGNKGLFKNSVPNVFFSVLIETFFSYKVKPQWGHGAHKREEKCWVTVFVAERWNKYGTNNFKLRHVWLGLPGPIMHALIYLVVLSGGLDLETTEA
jgi:hypothetical protein